jgi:hypothetical protein
MPSGDKYLLVLDGGDHSVFGGQTFARRSSSERDDEIRNDVKAATLVFWDAYLKGDVAAKKYLAAKREEKSSLFASLAAADRYEAK